MTEIEIRSVYSSGGLTRVQFTKSGKKLLVAGSHGILRVYEVAEEDSEPETFEILENTSDLAVFGENKFVISSEIGEVCLYSIESKERIGTVIRSALPIRGVAFTHNGLMVAAAGDDDEVQVADLKDNLRVIKFKAGDQVHDISYNPTVDLIALSLANGEIKIYSLTLEEPKLVCSIADEISKLIYQDDDDDAADNFLTNRVEWNPNGDEFAIPAQTRVIKVFSRVQDFKPSYSFPRIHEQGITDLKWSPNGDYLASADLENKLIVWDAGTREPIVEKKLSQKLINLAWTKENSVYNLIAGSDNGNILIFKGIAKEKSKTTYKPAQKMTVISDLEQLMAENISEDEDADDVKLVSEISNDDDDDGRDLKGFVNDGEEDESLRDFVDDDGFLDDDDNGGYIIPKKRPSEFEENDVTNVPRTQIRRTNPNSFTAVARKYKHKPYSQGCTPFISDRRYLTMNSIGYVSSVKQESFASITVSFFDQSVHREYHFDDIYGYDLASLTKHGILLGCSGDNKNDARILFRPHTNTADSWEKEIPTREGEILTTVSLSESIILICTSVGYIRNFSLFGIPQSIQKTAPIIASATNTNYIFTISLSNNSQLIYNLQDLDGRYLQRDLSLPLEFSTDRDLLKGIFFSTHGDPVIVGNDDVVLILLRWRNPLQATWVPILDSDIKIKEIGKGNLNIWPLGLYRENLNCIIIRGSEYPPYPLTLPSELEVKLPINKENSDIDLAEEELVRAKTLGELLGESLSNEGEIFEDDNEILTEYAIVHDKAILKLFSVACLDEKNAKAWKLAQDLKQDKALAASTKIAERVGLIQLVNRINKLRERRMESEIED